MPGSVLLVMENAEEVVRYQQALHEVGCAVTAFTSFRLARLMLEISPPTVLVTELQLGQFSGLHLAVVARLGAPKVPTLVTGEADAFATAECAAIGADYVARPSPAELAGLVRRLFSGPEERRRARGHTAQPLQGADTRGRVRSVRRMRS